MRTIYLCLGNSDGRLTQDEWAQFLEETEKTVQSHVAKVHGFWHSLVQNKYQNACWCVEIEEAKEEKFRMGLRMLAKQFRQQSIKYDVVPQPEFLGSYPFS